jgi:hypothetical protein
METTFVTSLDLGDADVQKQIIELIPSKLTIKFTQPP